MKKHTFNIFPPANKDDYNLLVADMKANGYDQALPITLFNGDILDGWNRYLACLELNIEPVTVAFSGSEMEAHAFTMRTNKRRNLTSSQWAAVAAEAEEVVQCIAEAVEVERRNNISTSRKSEMVQLIVPSKKDTSRLATTKTAETFNTNRTYVNVAKKLRVEEPEVFERVKSGEATITQIEKEKKIAIRKADIDQQREDIKNNEFTCGEGVYQVLAIDPPWNYGREYDPDGSRAANPYPEMTQAELLAIELPSDDDCVLFLWTTHKFLFDAKELVDKWGFEYKATLVWNKESMGLGSWLRMQCEFCLVAIKGKPIFDNTTWRDIITEKRREHSRKPEAFYQMVEEITVGRRLEYFSRAKREGWEVFGNDVEKF